MNNFEEIGKRLKEYAINEHFSVANLERKLGMKPKSLSQYITGRNKPGPKLLNELRLLDCDTEWIMTGKKNIAVELPKDHLYQIESNMNIYAHYIYGDKIKLVKQLNISIDQYDDFPYKKGKDSLGLLVKLADIGCDINWLLTNNIGSSVEATEDYRIKHNIEERLSKVENAITALKVENYDLKKELERKNEELLQKHAAIEALFNELGKNLLVLAQIDELRRKYNL